MSERIDIDFSRPKALFQAEPEMFQRIHHAYPDYRSVIQSIHFDGSPFTKRRNQKLLDVLGDYKDQVVEVAERMGNDRVTSVEYFVNPKSVPVERSQNDIGPHMDSVIGGIALLTASVLPTVTFVRPNGMSDEEFDPYPYLKATPFGNQVGDYDFDETLVENAVRAGQLEEYRLHDGDVFAVGKRIHKADTNRTGRVLPRIFIAAEVVYRG